MKDKRMRREKTLFGRREERWSSDPFDNQDWTIIIAVFILLIALIVSPWTLVNISYNFAKIAGLFIVISIIFNVMGEMHSSRGRH